MRLTSDLQSENQLSARQGDGADKLGQKEHVLVESLFQRTIHNTWNLDTGTTSVAHGGIESPFRFVLELFHGLIDDTIDR